MATRRGRARQALAPPPEEGEVRVLVELLLLRLTGAGGAPSAAVCGKI